MTRDSEVWQRIKPFAMRDIGDLIGLTGGSYTGGGSDYVIYLYDATNEKLRTYSCSEDGLAGAIAAAQSGDTIWVPAYNFEDDYTIPSGVTLIGIGPNSEFFGNITNNGVLVDVQIAQTADGFINTSGQCFNVIVGPFGLLNGGYGNTLADIWANTYQTIIGGYGNSTLEDSNFGAIIGSRESSIDGDYQFIGGGQSNTIGLGGSHSAIISGNRNSIGNTNYANAILAGVDNAIGDAAYYSACGGRKAKILDGHVGTFLWADGTNADFSSTAANEFAVRASGGFRFFNGTQTMGFNASGQITSDLAIGTAPLDVTSTTVCTNLNADMVDGLHGASLPFAPTARGDMIYANATPAWARLALGGANKSVLTRGASDPAWSGYYLSGTNAKTYTFPNQTGTVALGAGTCTVSSTNTVAGTANHTHAITSSSIPGAAASILATDAGGNVTVVGLAASEILTTLIGAADSLSIDVYDAGLDDSTLTIRNPTAGKICNVDVDGWVAAVGLLYSNTTGAIDVATGKTLNVDNTINISGTDNENLVLTKGLTVTTNAGTIAFGAAAKTLTVNDSCTLAGTGTLTLTTNLTNQGAAGVIAWGGAYTMTVPATDTVAMLGVANAFTNQNSVNRTITATGATEHYSILSQITAAPTGASSGWYRAMIFNSIQNSTQNLTATSNSGALTGLFGSAYLTNSGLVTAAIGAQARIQAYGANNTNCTDAYVFHAHIINWGGGGTMTIANTYNYYSRNPTGAALTISGNAYGFYSEDITKGSTANYAILTNAGNVVFNEGGDANTDVRMEGDTDANLFMLDASVDAIGIGVAAGSVAGKLHVDQAAAAGDKAVLVLDQGDNDRDFIRWIGISANADLTRSIIDAGDVGSASIVGYLKQYIQDDGTEIADGYYWIPIYTVA